MQPLVPVPSIERSIGISAPNVTAGAGASGEGLRQAGADLTRSAMAEGERMQREAEIAAEKKRQQDERDAAVWVTGQLAKTRMDWTTRAAKAEEEAPAGAENYTPQLMAQFNSDTATLVAQAPTPSAKAALQERLSSMQADQFGRAISFESHSRIVHAGNTLQQSVNTNAQAVRQDPHQFASAVGDSVAAIEASRLPADEKEKATVSAKQQIAAAAINAEIDAHPAQARKDLIGGAWADYLPADHVEHFIDLAKAEMDRRDAEAKRQQAEYRAQVRATVLDTVENDRAQIALTGKPSGTLKPSDMEIAYGKEGAAKVQRQLNELAANYRMQTSIALNSPEEDAALLKLPPSGDPDYAFKAQELEQRARAVDAKRAAVAKDSAGYVFQASPMLQQQFARGETDADAMKLAYTQSLELQRHLGAADPQPLPATIAKEIVDRYHQAPNPEAQLALLKRYVVGDATMQSAVMQQLEGLAGANGLKAGTGGLLNRSASPGDYRASLKNLAALNMPLDAKSLPNDTRKNVDKAIADSPFADFLAQRGHQAMLTGNPAYIRKAQDEAEAFTKMVTVEGLANGGDYATAAKKIYEENYHGERLFTDQSLAFVTVPSSADQATVDRGLRQLRDEAAERLKTSGLSAGAGPVGTRIDEQGIEDIRTGAVWVDDGPGYVLMPPGLTAPISMPIGPRNRPTSFQPWRVSLADVEAAAKRALKPGNTARGAYDPRIGGYPPLAPSPSISFGVPSNLAPPPPPSPAPLIVPELHTWPAPMPPAPATRSTDTAPPTPELAMPQRWRPPASAPRTAPPATRPPAPGARGDVMPEGPGIVQELKLTTQEQHLYGHHVDALANRNFVRNDDGSISTVRQIVVEHGGRFYSIPTVWDGKIVGQAEAERRVTKEGWNRWPDYASPAEADARYQTMHPYIEGDLAKWGLE